MYCTPAFSTASYSEAVLLLSRLDLPSPLYFRIFALSPQCGRTADASCRRTTRQDVRHGAPLPRWLPRGLLFRRARQAARLIHQSPPSQVRGSDTHGINAASVTAQWRGLESVPGGLHGAMGHVASVRFEVETKNMEEV